MLADLHFCKIPSDDCVWFYDSLGALRHRALSYHHKSRDAHKTGSIPTYVHIQHVIVRGPERGVCKRAARQPPQPNQGDVTGAKQPRSVSEHGTLGRFHVLFVPVTRRPTQSGERGRGEAPACESPHKYTRARAQSHTHIRHIHTQVRSQHDESMLRQHRARIEARSITHKDAIHL
jgi:hypothetical protein